MTIEALVLKELEDAEAAADTLGLWREIWRAFEDGGPEVVKTLVEERVRASRALANLEIADLTSIAVAPARKPRPRRSAGAKRGG